MDFARIAAAPDLDALGAAVRASTDADVRRALRREQPSVHDVAALVSPAARIHMAEMTRRASRVTAMRFGRVINLYAPLYLSNECTNHCVYCGFAKGSGVARRSLTLDEAVDNARALRDEGFRHVLLLTGEHPARYGIGDIERVVCALGDLFHSISIEVFPMDRSGYARLARAGVDGLTVYQETYDRRRYAAIHPRGRKADFDARLAAVEDGGEAGFRTLGVGALLGLADWRAEAVALAHHAAHLRKRFWRCRIAVSFPRLVGAGRGFAAPAPVSDEELVQMMVALRLVLPDAEMVVSTREPAALRDRLVGLAVTRMSAGSRTSPGGYVDGEAGDQFRVVDSRTPAEVSAMLVERGHEPVWKDFDRVLR